MRWGNSGVAPPSCDCNYGILPNVQLHIQPGMAFAQANGTPLFLGPGDMEFGVKYRFIEQDKTSSIPVRGSLPFAGGAHGRCCSRARYWQDSRIRADLDPKGFRRLDDLRGWRLLDQPRPRQ